jgi:hypothetical protein
MMVAVFKDRHGKPLRKPTMSLQVHSGNSKSYLEWADALYLLRAIYMQSKSFS